MGGFRFERNAVGCYFVAQGCHGRKSSWPAKLVFGYNVKQALIRCNPLAWHQSWRWQRSPRLYRFLLLASVSSSLIGTWGNIAKTMYTRVIRLKSVVKHLSLPFLLPIRVYRTAHTCSRFTHSNQFFFLVPFVKLVFFSYTSSISCFKPSAAVSLAHSFLLSLQNKKGKKREKYNTNIICFCWLSSKK